MEIYTVGFTQKTAAQFFELLRRHGIRRLVDVRLNNVSQLAGFSKRDDLAYFLRESGYPAGGGCGGLPCDALQLRAIRIP